MTKSINNSFWFGDSICPPLCMEWCVKCKVCYRFEWKRRSSGFFFGYEIPNGRYIRGYCLHTWFGIQHTHTLSYVYTGKYAHCCVLSALSHAHMRTAKLREYLFYCFNVNTHTHNVYAIIVQMNHKYSMAAFWQRWHCLCGANEGTRFRLADWLVG